MQNQTDQRNPVDVLAEEFLDRHRRGDPVSIDDYVKKHPEFAQDIWRLFTTMVAIEKIKTCRPLASSSMPVCLEFRPLQQLGDYRIIREIGRGGMGVVYEAEQLSLHRRVAVKVFPRQTLRNSRQLKRFRREARTAASLHHTNIVPVFGVGEQDGSHYYVMQRIEGTALDQLINCVLPESSGGDRAEPGDRAVPTEGVDPVDMAGAADRASQEQMNASSPGTPKTDRIASLNFQGLIASVFPGEGGDQTPVTSIPDLVANRTRTSRAQWRAVTSVGMQVAEALAYAHAKGVIHRDIKPSNLLVDPQGTVWVTDFGLATFLESEKLSNPGDVGGTLRFMAPEHIGGEPDARSDMYSLGLTLYELLTLQPAFREKRPAEMISKILKGDLVPPRKVRPEIPRDLEAIILKSIAREPARRYRDAASMAIDLKRFAEGHPVQARQIGPIGRSWRWTRRNAAVASLSALLMLVAVCSFVLIGAKWRDAVMENRRAESNLSLALESIDQILERFGAIQMDHPTETLSEDSDNASSTAVQMAVADNNVSALEDTLKFYDRFAEQNATNPQLRRNTAKVHRRVADIYDRLGQYAKAEQAYERSLAILNSEPSNDDATLVVEKAGTLNHLGLTLYATSRFAEAESNFRRAKATLVNSNQINQPHCQAELARTHNNLGRALWLLRRREEAEQSHRRAMKLLERLVPQHPEDAEYRLALARAYRIYYPFVPFGTEPDQRDRIRNAGIEILEKLVLDYPTVPDYQCELSEMLVATTVRRGSARDSEQRAIHLRRAAKLSRELYLAHPSIPRYRAVLARVLKDRAEMLSKTNRAKANELYEESTQLYRSLARDFADIPSYHVFLAVALRDHAASLHDQGRTDDSLGPLQEGIDELHAYVALRPENPFGGNLLARLYTRLAATLTALDENEAADQAFREAQRIRQQSESRDAVSS